MEKKLSYYITTAKEIKAVNYNKKIRVAVLSSFTINGIEEVFKVKCNEKEIECSTYLGGYNQYSQNILDKQSNLYRFAPDITFLILDTRSLLGNLFHSPYSISESQRREYVTSKLNELLSIIDVFSKNIKSKLIVANFSSPTYSPYGIFDTKTVYGFKEMILDINGRLAKEISKIESVYLYDFSNFVTKFGEINIFDFKQFFFGDIKIALDYIPYLVNDLFAYVIAVLGLTKRCIVLDLDNTLWGGIVGEIGRAHV